MYYYIYLIIVGNIRNNLILQLLKGDILRHLIFVILENSFIPSHLTFHHSVYHIPKFLQVDKNCEKDELVSQKFPKVCFFT